MAYFKIHVAVHLFLVRDNEILLLRRFNTGYEDGNYSVIAGHMTGGENVYEAICRETLEEAGIVVSTHDMRIVQVMNRRKPISEGLEERIDYFFAAEKWNGKIRVAEPNKCDQIKWFPIDHLPDNMVPYVRQAIKWYQLGIPFTVFGWEDE